MAGWFRIVVCPNCSSMREVGISQLRRGCAVWGLQAFQAVQEGVQQRRVCEG